MSIQCAYTMNTHLDYSETEITLVQHDDFIFIGAIIHHMAEGKQGGRVGKDSAPPGRVPFMCYNQVLLMGHNGFIEDSRVIVFIWGSEVILNSRIKALFENGLVS